MPNLAPCGTFTAYKRHKRKDEPVDEACAQAARDQANSRNQRKRQAHGEVVLSIVRDQVENGPELPDRLEAAREDLRIVEATLQSTMTPAGAIAGLTRRREELVERVLKLASAQEDESLADKLAAVRAARNTGA